MTDLHPWRHEPRKRLTDHQRAAIFLDRGGKCHRCERKLRSGDCWQLDHILALENGGKDEPSNLAPCCSWCHKGKTAEDHGKAAKGRAVATSCIIPRSQRQKKGRPMPGSRASGWKQKLSGEWVRR
jgi:5-methylcytosine-specific restriction protein A